MPEVYMMVTQTALEESYGPVMLPPHKAWLTMSLYPPEDIQTIRELDPESLQGGPDIGPEDSLVVLHHNHIEVEDLQAFLEAALESLKNAQAPE